MSGQYIYADGKIFSVDDAEEPQGESKEAEIKRLQNEIAALRNRIEIEEMLDRLNRTGEQRNKGNQKKEETMKGTKSPFVYRVDLWNIVNMEIAQVEEFLNKVYTKPSWIQRFFGVCCFSKNRKGFVVEMGYRMEIPIGLQEKMIRAAEEYLEELKKQKKDMEEGYDV